MMNFDKTNNNNNTQIKNFKNINDNNNNHHNNNYKIEINSNDIRKSLIKNTELNNNIMILLLRLKVLMKMMKI